MACDDPSRPVMCAGWALAGLVSAGVALVVVFVQSSNAHAMGEATRTRSVEARTLSSRPPGRQGAILASFDLGVDPGDDLRLGTRKRVFHPDDTIVVSIDTQVVDGEYAAARIDAIFTYAYEGEVMDVSRQSRDLALDSAGITNFMISKPDGFPEGTYHVEVRINDVIIGKTRFDVAP